MDPSSFDKARRKEAYRRVLEVIARRRRPIPWGEVTDRVHVFEQTYEGVRSIPVARIAGSIERSSDLTSDFLPRGEAGRQRWEELERVFSQTGFPPISVYELGQNYWVIDGRHRVAIAKQQKMDYIDAEVTRLHARYEIKPDVDIGQLILAEQERLFMEGSGLASARPGASIKLTRPHFYAELLELVKVHGYDLMREQNRLLTPGEIAAHWYEHVFVPTTEAIRREGLLEAFPRSTAADLFLVTWQQRRALFPERRDLSLEETVHIESKGWPARLRRAFTVLSQDPRPREPGT